MESTLRKALVQRRSYYEIDAKSPAGEKEIEEIVDFAVLHTPSAFNSQSARVVLLFREHHKRLWEIVREALRPLVPPEKFGPTDAKIDAFAAGYGTILFYEDQATIEKLQTDFLTYRDAFPGFSANSSGMLQHVVWVMLREAGLGASLQHYGNLIESEVACAWGLDPRWKLIAQMPYGRPLSEPEAKTQMPLSERVKIFQ
jgi:Predicted oxidoreductase related to nitroreductase